MNHPRSIKALRRAFSGFAVPALLAKGGTWSEADLDQFLTDAGKFAPGSTKSIRLRDPEQRREIIDFLKTLRPKE